VKKNDAIKNLLVICALTTISRSQWLLERLQFPEDANLIFRTLIFFKAATNMDIYYSHSFRHTDRMMTGMKRALGGALGSIAHRKLTAEKKEMIRRERAAAKRGTWTATKKKLASKLDISVRSVERAALSEE
jgi:hypothetical protein